jgi:2,3-bisphosphoglycerate-dependent phosphoglycerate mutase
MAQLILLRHLESQWNKENRFTGWTDVSLSEEGVKNAEKVAEKISGFTINKVYTSPLIRNKNTVSLILEKLDKKYLPVFIDEALDERNYGDLQGFNKDEIKVKYGEEQVRLWRRSWEYSPPGGESLKDVYNRVVPFYENNIQNDLEENTNVLVVASHNSLRALVKYLEKISNEDIINLEIPTGSLRVYEFNKGLIKLIKK